MRVHHDHRSLVTLNIHHSMTNANMSHFYSAPCWNLSLKTTLNHCNKRSLAIDLSWSALIGIASSLDQYQLLKSDKCKSPVSCLTTERSSTVFLTPFDRIMDSSWWGTFFASLCAYLLIKKFTSTTYSCQTNWQLEQYNQTLLSLFQLLITDKKDIGFNMCSCLHMRTPTKHNAILINSFVTPNGPKTIDSTLPY